MHTLVNELHQDHTNLNKLLNLLERELTLFRQGESPDYLLLLAIVDYIESYPDLIHHPREDAIFNVYLKRNDEGAQIIQKLMDEHLVLVELSHQIRNLIEQVMNGSVLSRDIIETNLAGYIEMQRNHLNVEEREAFALIDASLQPEDWEHIERIIPAQSDPIFGGPVQKRYQVIYEQIIAIAIAPNCQ